MLERQKLKALPRDSTTAGTLILRQFDEKLVQLEERRSSQGN